MPTCSIKQCRARVANNPGLTLHRLPSNKAMKKKWLEIIGPENLKSKVKMWHVCSMHFDESCINKTLHVQRLKDGAMPSPSLLPKPSHSSKKTSSNNMVSQKSTSCENKARSPSPMRSDLSEDSSTENTLVEEAINTSGFGASCTTFAKAWSPIPDSPDPTIDLATNMDSPAPTAIGSPIEMDSPALPTIGPPKDKSKSQQYLQTITIHRQNNKIKNLTKRCQSYQQKVKRLYEKIRRRDGRIAQLSYVIDRLKENICFNNEGAIILDETEDPEDLAEANTKIRNFEDCISSSAVSTTNQVPPRSTGRPLSSRAKTLDSPPSKPRQTKAILKSTKTPDHPPSAANQTPLSTRATTPDPPLTACKTKPILNSITTPDPQNSASSQTQLPISVLSLNTSKSNDTKGCKETNSKDLMFEISPLKINTQKKVIKSKHLKQKLSLPIRKTLKLQETTDHIQIKDTISTDLQLKVPTARSPNRKLLNIHDITDHIKDTQSKEKVPPSPNIKTVNLNERIDLIKHKTTKDLRLTIPPLPVPNRKMLKLRSTDLVKDTTPKDLTVTSPPKILKSNESTNLIEETTPDETALTIPSLDNEKDLNTQETEEALNEQESADLIEEITSKVISTTLHKSSITDKNAFIYIIEVD